VFHLQTDFLSVFSRVQKTCTSVCFILVCCHLMNKSKRKNWREECECVRVCLAYDSYSLTPTIYIPFSLSLSLSLCVCFMILPHSIFLCLTLFVHIPISLSLLACVFHDSPSLSLVSFKEGESVCMWWCSLLLSLSLYTFTLSHTIYLCDWKRVVGKINCIRSFVAKTGMLLVKSLFFSAMKKNCITSISPFHNVTSMSF